MVECSGKQDCPLKANTMHTIASILLSVLGIYSPADVAGLPTHLYKN